MKKIVGFVLCFCFLFSISIGYSDFHFVYSYNTYSYLKDSENLSVWWDNADEKHLVALWVNVIKDIALYDPLRDSLNMDLPLAIFGLDKSSDDIHFYLQDREGRFRHVQLFNSVPSRDGLYGFMIYEINGVSLSKAQEFLNQNTLKQFTFSYDTFLKYF